MPPGPTARSAVLLAALALAGCGSRPASELPPAATPATAKAEAAPPAGRVVRIGGEPRGIVADAETGTLAIALGDAVALADARTGAIRRRVSVPATGQLRLAAPGGPVLAPGDGLAEIALPGGAVTTTPAGREPRDAVVAGRTFVADAADDALRVLPDGRLPTALEPSRLAAADDGRKVASLAVRGRVLELFDATTLRRVGRADAGVGPAALASDGENLLYVVDVKLGALLVFSIRPELQLMRRLTLPGGPTAIFYDREHRRMWATLAEANELAELRVGARPTVYRRFPTVRGPAGVAVDARTGRVYVTGADGELQLFDPPPLRRAR